MSVTSYRALEQYQAQVQLLLTPREAAATLAISERHLWTLTKAGKIPSLRLGRSVRYRREALERFAAAQEGGGR